MEASILGVLIRLAMIESRIYQDAEDSEISKSCKVKEGSAVQSVQIAIFC